MGPTPAAVHAPNFFIVGAPKAGTTSLYRYLEQHPAVFMSPIKEPAFFSPEIPDFDERVATWENYLRLFENAGSATARGEASCSYLASPSAPSAIRERIPGARIIMMLRDPVDRLFSHYAYAVASGLNPGTFGDWIDRQINAEASRTPRAGAIWAGMYARHLKAYRAVFPREQIRVFVFEDFRDRTAAVLQDVFRFLEVDADHRVNTSESYNVTAKSRSPALDRLLQPVKPVLKAILPKRVQERARAWTRRPPGITPTPTERARVSQLYEQQVHELEEMIGRDLSSWRR